MKKLLLMLAMMLTMTSCYKVIGGDSEGVKVKLTGTEKGVDDVTLKTGRVWYNPFNEEVIRFPNYVKILSYEFDINDLDGTKFDIKPTIEFRIINGRSVDIYKKYRTNDLDALGTGTIFTAIQEAYRAEMTKTSTQDIISKRSQVDENIRKRLSESLERNGFTLDALSSGIQYPPELVKAVNDKNVAIQKAITVDNELAIVEAMVKKEIMQAEGDAKVKLIAAEAEAKRIEMVGKSLTQKYNEYYFINTWGTTKTPLYGFTPQFMKQM